MNHDNTKRESRPIDNVTVQYLDIALRMCDISIPASTLDKIIDLVELIEEKGGEVSIEDVVKLQIEWKPKPTNP